MKPKDADEFLRRMQQIYEPEPPRHEGAAPSIDHEETHHESDLLMEEKLIELGYGAAIAFLRTRKRWYA